MIRRFLHALLLLVFVLLCGSLHGQQGHYIRFEVEDKPALDTITRLVSIDAVHGTTVYAYATDAQLERFKARTTLDFSLLPLPKRKSGTLKMAGDHSQMSGWDHYPTYDLYEAMMDSMASAHPGICRLDTIGFTSDGRRLLVMRITDHPDSQEDEPEVFFTSSMHGDELVGYVLMLRLADTLLSSYGKDQRLTSMVNEMDIFINPLANPDGAYAGGNHTLSQAQRYNANGVDLNRNFPDPQDGPHPDGLSWQSETLAMMNFAEDRHITLSANFHGGTEVANYPWDTWQRQHVDSTWFRHISSLYAESAQANSAAGYFTSIHPSGITNGHDWYSISGGRQDYMNYFQQAREITLEVSDTKLPDASLLPDFWRYNRQAMLLYMEECRYGLRGVVTNASGEPIAAKVEMSGHDQDRDSSMVFTDPQAGDYHRMIAPGSYDVHFSAPGYRDTIIQGVPVMQGASTRVDVSLDKRATDLNGPGTGHLSNLRCFPNPFRNSLNLEVLLEQPVEQASISITDSRGRIIRMLREHKLPPGRHLFHLVDESNQLAPGIYFIRVSTQEHEKVIKVLKLH